jgi:DNA-binding HxlR family transcriptional regulator
LARALDLVGERWALLVVRELLHGPKRFSAIRAGLSGISPNVLSQRLDELVDRGIAERRRLASPADVDVYALTPLGRELAPALVALARWGGRAIPPQAGQLSVDALLLAFRTTAGDTGRCPFGRYGLVIGHAEATVEVGLAGVTARYGPAVDPVATISAETATLRALAFGGRRLAEAVDGGAATVTGDVDAAERFLGLFERLPLFPR